MLAMERAIAGLEMEVDFVIVDGNRIPDIACEAEWLIRGDTKIDAIKAASIIAKVARDNEMTRLDKIYPEYGLAKHKGYPTREHREAIRRFGVTPVPVFPLRHVKPLLCRSKAIPVNSIGRFTILRRYKLRIGRQTMLLLFKGE